MIECPLCMEVTGEPDVNCENCFGTGDAYHKCQFPDCGCGSARLCMAGEFAPKESVPAANVQFYKD